MTDHALDLDLLRRLTQTPGVPGAEDRVRALIEDEVAGLFDEVRTDPMGNLLCRRDAAGGARDPRRVMLLCHMDEIGFLVSHVTKEGFAYIQPVGGFDPRTLFARRVTVCTRDGDVPGVLNPGGRPVHIATPEDRKKVPELSEFFVDTGLGEAARDRLRVGDMVVLDGPLQEMGERIVSKALDNRIACWLGIEAIRALGDARGQDEIHVAFTVQEEVGLRGARTAAFAVRPHVGIGIDTTLACDTPGVPEADRTTRQGDGFGLHLRDGSFVSDRGLAEEFASLAEARGIPFQRTMLRSGGQDGAAAQQAAAGAKAVGIVVGTRYIHTVCETVHRGDLLAARDVLAAYLGAPA
ncbi:endoglucanase [Hasllibacter halocynthiae]|uniref:Endoglucanase n=1 Tax=Hasllibacter halocynthiae TaxID=595589 RepID=A0A2T0X6Z1_9RHOB|nr:M20/M25/M40 family metallo-hydrolase [Hasllibacter halocynthiae]PRY94693.1 endoglucanase [Hasllibacter halocynthiae]